MNAIAQKSYLDSCTCNREAIGIVSGLPQQGEIVKEFMFWLPKSLLHPGNCNSGEGSESEGGRRQSVECVHDDISIALGGIEV